MNRETYAALLLAIWDFLSILFWSAVGGTLGLFTVATMYTMKGFPLTDQILDTAFIHGCMSYISLHIGWELRASIRLGAELKRYEKARRTKQED